MTYSLEYVTRVSHDFGAQPLCVVPVVLRLHNSSRRPVRVAYRADVDAGSVP